MNIGGHNNRNNIEFGSIKYIKNKFNIKNIIDVGCGPGDMKFTCDKLNIEYQGIEGDINVIKDKKYIIYHNFENKYDYTNEYDLGYSTEFLEHVNEEYMDNYMKVFEKCKYILITAAPPKWPGYHHVNCQGHKYWLKKFNEYGFVLDCYNTLQIRNKSTMNLGRGNHKRFIQHRGLFFINSKYKNIKLEEKIPAKIIENTFYKSNIYIDIKIPKWNTNSVTNTNNYLFVSTIPIISYYNI
tara:strand:- start:1054 stop:1773 length:720 start_codon:yes stop_codon:yes gene_type:complete